MPTRPRPPRERGLRRRARSANAASPRDRDRRESEGYGVERGQPTPRHHEPEDERPEEDLRGDHRRGDKRPHAAVISVPPENREAERQKAGDRADQEVLDNRIPKKRHAV